MKKKEIEMDVYRVTKDSPRLLKAYDYIRVDAFVFGQNIPMDKEFSHDDPVDDNFKAVVLVEDNKPVAGSRITFPKDDIGKIGRVCVARQFQRKKVGSRLIKESEDWIRELGVTKVVINSQDRAQGFYEKLGYVLVPGVDPVLFESRIECEIKDIPRDYVPQINPLGFSCVLVEKELS